MISEELITAYNNTQFCVFDPAIIIKVGETNTALDKLLKQHDKNDWTFITASNPYSNILSNVENNARYLTLKEALKEFSLFEGEGIGEDPSWEPEQSLLVIGIGRMAAIAIGQRFQQNAIIVGSAGQPAVLEILIW